MAWGNKGSAEQDFLKLLTQVETSTTASESLTILRSKYSSIWEQNKCSSKLAKALQTNTTLVEINCLGLPFDVDSCKILAESLQKNKSLRKLKFGDGTFGDAHVQALFSRGNLGSLQILDLERRNLTSESCRAIGTALRTKECRIQTLLLGFNNIGDEGLFTLAEGLRRGCRLKTIDLRDTSISSSGLQVFAHAVASQEIKFSHLDVSFNPDIGPLGCAVLASIEADVLIADACESGDAGAIALLMGKPRRSLSLSENGISHKGAALLSELAFLGDHPPMSLSLRQNPDLKDAGVAKIAESVKNRSILLQAAPPIPFLDLSSSAATHLPLAFLSGSIISFMYVGNGPLDHSHVVAGFQQQTSTLKAVSLSGTGITDIMAVFRALHSHPSLSTVEFGGIPLTEAARTALAELKEANPNLDVAVDKGVEENH